MKKEKRGQTQQPPTLEQLTAELARENYKRRFGRVLRSTLFTLVVVAAVAVLVLESLQLVAAAVLRLWVPPRIAATVLSAWLAGRRCCLPTLLAGIHLWPARPSL